MEKIGGFIENTGIFQVFHYISTLENSKKWGIFRVVKSLKSNFS